MLKSIFEHFQKADSLFLNVLSHNASYFPGMGHLPQKSKSTKISFLQPDAIETPIFTKRYWRYSVEMTHMVKTVLEEFEGAKYAQTFCHRKWI